MKFHIPFCFWIPANSFNFFLKKVPKFLILISELSFKFEINIFIISFTIKSEKEFGTPIVLLMSLTISFFNIFSLNLEHCYDLNFFNLTHQITFYYTIT